MEITEFATYLVKNIVKNPDLVKVSAFTQDEDETILEILVSNEDMVKQDRIYLYGAEAHLRTQNKYSCYQW